jgi:hypothetical protein
VVVVGSPNIGQMGYFAFLARVILPGRGFNRFERIGSANRGREAPVRVRGMPRCRLGLGPRTAVEPGADGMKIRTASRP